MSASSLRVIVSGLIAQYPLGGVTWDYVQYVVGLHQLGHDVYYIEDTGQWPYNPREDGIAKDCAYNVEYLASVMARFGLSDRWAYRFPWQSRWFGLTDGKREEVVRTADLLINVSGALARAQEYRSIGCLAYVDSDPVFTQVKYARGQRDFQQLVDAHDVHFSFGERLQSSGKVPPTPIDWRPTRQPVVLSEWANSQTHRPVFTTVMNWTSYKPVVFAGVTYGQKDVEFNRFIDLPNRVGAARFELAVNSGKTSRTPYSLLAHRGWRIVDPEKVCPDLDTYRRYLQTSEAEWSVAKHGYVEGQPGWFSCRSACYLAAGRPVIVQDTGFDDVLPVGEGLLSFSSIEDTVAAIAEVDAHYNKHSAVAKTIAKEYFDANRVLRRLVEQAFASREMTS